MRRLLRIAIALFFVSPILTWLVIIDRWSTPGIEWLRPLAESMIQASASALASVILGVLMAAGALSARGRFERGIEYWLLGPNLIPQIFLILAILNLSSWIPILRGSLAAVIVAHTLLNSGLVAVALIRLMGWRLTGFLDAAVIAGARRRMIWIEVVLPSLGNELFFLFLFVFSVCLTSFSIPLVLGGLHISNFEILIYETLRTTADWSRAIYYVLVQMAALSILAYLLPRPRWNSNPVQPPATAIGSRALLPLTVFPSLLLVGGWVIGLSRSFRHFVPEDIPLDLEVAAANTMIVGLGVGFLTLLLCLAIAYVTPHHRFFLFMKGFLAPSSAITGFAFLLLPGKAPIGQSSKLSWRSR